MEIETDDTGKKFETTFKRLNSMEIFSNAPKKFYFHKFKIDLIVWKSSFLLNF